MDVLENLLALASQKINAGAFEDARGLCRQVLKAAPNAVTAINLMGVVEFELRNYHEAARHFKRVAQMAPKDPNVRVNLAQSLLKDGRPAEAIAVLKSATALAPTSEQAHGLLASIYENADDLRAAIKVLCDFAQRGGKSIAVLTRIAANYAALCQWDQVLKYADLALAVDATSAEAQAARADALFYLRRPAEAARAYATVFALEKGTEKINKATLDMMMRDAALMAALHADGAAEKILSAAPASGDFGAARRDDWETTASTVIARTIGADLDNDPVAIFYHAESGDNHPFVTAGSDVSDSIDYRGVLEMSCRRARQVTPGIKIIVVTDTATDVGLAINADHVVRLAVNSEQLMYSRMRSYRALVTSGRIKAPVLFLDTDVLLNRDVRVLFDGSFDVGLTDRPNMFPLMPVNEGVILGARGDSSKLATFFGACLTLFEGLAEHPAVKQRYPFDIRHWRGGQLSLAAFINWDVPPFVPRAITRHGVNIKFFSGDDYNYPVKHRDALSDLAGKWALHFKGSEAKARMSEYLEYTAQTPL